MVAIDPMGFQAAAYANNPQIASSNLLSNPSGAVGVARNESQETREKTATPPVSSTQVNISESGRARLQAEGANAMAAPETTQATSAQQTMQATPVAAPIAAPDIRNDSMLTAVAPAGMTAGGASVQGTSADSAAATAMPAPADPASPIAAVAPVVSDAPRSVASSGTEAATPANPGTMRAESGRQQVEALATQAEARQSDNRANQQDMSPALAQGGVAAYRDIFSG